MQKFFVTSISGGKGKDSILNNKVASVSINIIADKFSIEDQQRKFAEFFY